MGDGVSDPLFPETIVFMTEDRNITAIFEPKICTVQVLTEGAGDANGSGDYAFGDVIQINATASLGHRFSHWEGVDTNESNATITISEDLTVKAFFVPQEYNLSFNPSNPAAGTVVSSGGPYTYGSITQIYATPAFGYKFSRWALPPDSANSIDSNTSIAAEITTYEDGNITAHFEKIEYEVIINLTEGGQSVSDINGTYGLDEIIEIQSVAKDGYLFTKWLDPAGVLSNKYNNPTDLNMSLAKGTVELTALFSPQNFSINLVEGTGGNIIFDTPNGPWYYGETYSLNAVPINGYEFISWNGDADSISSLAFDNNVSQNQLVVNGPINLNAYFAPLNIEIVTSSGLGGSATGNNNYTVDQTPVLTAIPDAGWEFSHWEGNASAISFLSSNTSTPALVNLTNARLFFFTLQSFVPYNLL